MCNTIVLLIWFVYRGVPVPFVHCQILEEGNVSSCLGGHYDSTVICPHEVTRSVWVIATMEGEDEGASEWANR